MKCTLIAFYLFLAGILLTTDLKAQYSKFNGIWVSDSESIKPDENTSGVVTIIDDTVSWNIFNNQIFFNFTYKMKGDTLLLLYKSCECSHAFKNSIIKYPPPKSIYAKLYHVSDTVLGVMYMNRLFKETVISYVRTKISKTDQRLLFPDVLFFKLFNLNRE